MIGTKVRVCSYNILGSDDKFDLLEKKILVETSNLSIICLQEVTVKFYSKLQILFEKHGYRFYYYSYGSKFDGYVGVGIAAPARYTLLDLEYFKISDGKDWVHINDRDPFGSIFTKTITGGLLDYTVEKYDNYVECYSQPNVMVITKLRIEEGREIYVGNVCMPENCYTPSMMVTYNALAIEKIQNIAKDDPYILAGSFDTTSQDFYYRLFTDGACNTKCLDEDFPTTDSWRPFRTIPMRNSLTQSNRMPISHTMKRYDSDGNIYEKAVDHIFVSLEFDIVIGFQPTFTKKPYPNESEPCSHLLIWVDLLL